jgi:hypothetical protein
MYKQIKETFLWGLFILFYTFCAARAAGILHNNWTAGSPISVNLHKLKKFSKNPWQITWNVI